MFSNLSLSSTSSATVTPSLVTVGAPQPLSMTALRPRGPRVTFTARASLETPARRDLRASTSKASSFAAMPGLLSRGSDSDSKLNHNWPPDGHKHPNLKRHRERSFGAVPITIAVPVDG